MMQTVVVGLLNVFVYSNVVVSCLVLPAYPACAAVLVVTFQRSYSSDQNVLNFAQILSAGGLHIQRP